MRRYAILLPVGHLLIDCLALLAWAWNDHSLRRAPSLITPVAFQESAPGMEFSPWFEPPDELVFIESGNVPAAFIDALTGASATARHGSTVDPGRFALHELTSTVLWFLLGWLIDSGIWRAARPMLFYLLFRAGLASLIILPARRLQWWRFEVIFCFGLVLYEIVRLIRNTTGGTRSALPD